MRNTTGYLEFSAIFTHVFLFILIFRHIFISIMSDSDESSATESVDDGYEHFVVVEDDNDLQDVDALVDTASNAYLRELEATSDLELRQPAKCMAMRTQLGAVGLFLLFFSRKLIQQLLQWTNQRRTKDGLDRITEQELQQCVGIEIYMSVVKLPNIADYWNQNLLGRTCKASTCMSRDCFKAIRPTIGFHPDEHKHNRKTDPLWHSRAIMSHFIKRATTVAIPKGCMAFDESSLRCRSRTKAKSYSPHKKDKFAIRLYTLVCSKFCYIYTFWDAAHGKRFTEAPGAQAYCNMFKTMRSYYERAFPESTLVEEDTSSALWAMMMAHPVRMDPCNASKRIFYTDSYYTRHALAKALLEMTDKRAFLTGTIKQSYMIKEDKIRVKPIVDEMNKHAKRGEWVLLQVFERDSNNVVRVAEGCGYICIKDTKVVVLYSNDLVSTPESEVCLGTSLHAIECVRGLAVIYRWTCDEHMKKTPIEVPALFAAYNLYMNGVDRVDQYRATAPVRRRERRVDAIIYSYIIDCSIHNAYAVSRKLDEENRTYYQFKIDLALTLMSALPNGKYGMLAGIAGMDGDEDDLNERNTIGIFKGAREGLLCIESSLIAGAGSDHIDHYLVETVGKKYVNCFVCNFMSKDRCSRTCNTCMACKKGYHPNCFALFHSSKASAVNPAVLEKFFRSVNDPKSVILQRVNNKCTPDSYNSLVLPFINEPVDV